MTGNNGQPLRVEPTGVWGVYRALPVRRYTMLERIIANGGDFNPGYTTDEDEAEVRELLDAKTIHLEKRPSLWAGLPDVTFGVLNTQHETQLALEAEWGLMWNVTEGKLQSFNEAFALIIQGDSDSD